jgi:phage shock protein E
MNTTGQRISVAKAKQLLAKGAVLLDARTPVHFRDGTIPGAVNLATHQLAQMLKHPKATRIIAFGVTDTDTTVNTVLGYLEQYGFTNLYTIGAIDNWFKDPAKPPRKPR